MIGIGCKKQYCEILRSEFGEDSLELLVLWFASDDWIDDDDLVRPAGFLPSLPVLAGLVVDLDRGRPGLGGRPMRGRSYPGTLAFGRDEDSN